VSKRFTTIDAEETFRGASPIGNAFAVRNADRVKRMVDMNTVSG
jgi:hypothetical protein